LVSPLKSYEVFLHGSFLLPVDKLLIVFHRLWISARWAAQNEREKEKERKEKEREKERESKRKKEAKKEK